MRYTYIPLLMAMALLGLAPTANAQGPAAGNCSLGTAQADLGANNALGRVFNNGSLFYGNGSSAFYFVPQAAQKSPVYASGLWVGGKVGGNLRVAGGTYGAPAVDFTFWPGPLDNATGRPVNPASCQAFDRIYSATQDEVVSAGGGGSVTSDVAAWPVELGAPYFVDADRNGVRNRDGSEPTIIRSPTDPGYGVNGTKIDIAGGQLPDIIGTQGIWWVMNDVGNVHPAQNTPPLGIEVQVLAFSFSRADALGNTTFYKYRIINKSGTDITDAYVSIFSDPDLGDAADDQVGSDVASGLGFVYNNDNVDGTGGGASYGTPPPAIGYDFFQGPIVADGPDAGSDPDTLGTSAFSYFSNTPGGASDPDNGIEIYNYMQGLWGDGSTMRAFGDGYQETQGNVTKFAFPGDPVTNQPWSAVNPGAGQTPISGADRRFAISTGPFTLANGDEQDIVFGIVFAVGQDNLDSITALRNADKIAQAAFNIGFDIPPPPPPPPLCVDGDPVLAPGSGRCFEAVTQNGQATLVWGYPTTSSNYLGQFEVFNGFLRDIDVPDKTYNFEGFNIYRYPTSSFDGATRQLVATFDVINGVTEVRDLAPDPAVNGEVREYISARGTDSGVQYSFDLPNLTNYTDYYYGITAYAYNAFSTPKANESSPTLITVRPSRLANDATTNSANGTVLPVSVVSQRGEGVLRARVVDPTVLTGNTYEVRFYNPTMGDGTVDTSVLTYNIVNTTTNTVVLDGQAYYNSTGNALPTGSNVTVVDGFTFDIEAPQPGYKDFQTVANAAGPIVPPVDGAMDPNATGFPDNGRETDHVQTPPVGQQSTNASRWGLHTACNSVVTVLADCGYDVGSTNFVARTTRNGDNFVSIGASDYEMRFTAGPNFAWVQYSSPQGLISVPFELWDVGTDPSAADDVRLFPLINEWPATNTTTGPGNLIYDLGADHPTSGGVNDPQTDWVYWFRPENTTPGRAGYDAALAAAQAQAPTYDLTGLQEEVFARTVLVNFNGGNAYGTTFNARLPETGTIFKIITFKPNQPGDTFSINTADLQLTAPTEEDIQRSLDRITAVPNPYFGTSAYESGNLSNIIRFTNLPEQPSTIRIFTVSGSLVTTLNKTSTSRSLDWNLQTSNNLPVASGMYLVHVDIEGVGERTLKLAVINRRTQVTIF